MAEDITQINTKKYRKFFLYVFLGIIIFFILLNLGVFGKVPSIEELKDPHNTVASEVYAEDGQMMGKIFTHNRVPVTYNELPAHVVNALIATEDSRFYIHNGIDPKAIIGVAGGAFSGGNRGGGSTITQQLAKNLFPRGKINKFQLIIRKFKEWIIAVKLERNLTKHEIIAAYLNTVEFSDNAFGIKAATRTYFNKDLKDLTVDEGAILVGMLKAPYKFNPRLHPESSIERRNVVLGKMREYNFLKEEEYNKLKNKPIKLDFNRDYSFYTAAPYFVRYVEKYLRNYFKTHPKKDGTTYDLYADGLKIYTTIDLTMQKYAEEAAEEHLQYYQKILNNHWGRWSPWHNRPKFFMRHVRKSQRYQDLKAKGLSEEQIVAELQKPIKMTIFSYEDGEKEVEMSPWDSIKYYNMFLQTGFMSIDPHTGHVKTWVGGANFKYFKYDHVNINTKRQVGSVFKPFLYATAIDQKGYSPCFRVPNQRIVFRPGNPKWKLAAAWAPSNSGGGYGGSPTLKEALSKSLNTVSARLMYEVGPSAVINLCRNLGIDSSTDLPPYPSICLGTPEISVFEMVGAYSAYANQGLNTKPTFITKIEDRYGNVIYENYPTFKESFRPEVAFVMQDLMRGVVDMGTAKRLKGRYNLKGDICGKTGTTQSNADGWFIGFTPNLVAGCWVGCDDRLVRFRSTGLGQGAAMALPIWGKFFEKLSKDPKYARYLEGEYETIDPSRRTIITDCSKYQGWGLTEKQDVKVIINTEDDSEGKYSEEEFDESSGEEENYDEESGSGMEMPVMKPSKPAKPTADKAPKMDTASLPKTKKELRQEKKAAKKLEKEKEQEREKQLEKAKELAKEREKALEKAKEQAKEKEKAKEKAKTK